MKHLLFIVNLLLLLSCSCSHRINDDMTLFSHRQLNESGRYETEYLYKQNGKESGFRVLACEGKAELSDNVSLYLLNIQKNSISETSNNLFPIPFEKEVELINNVVDTVIKHNLNITNVYLDTDFFGDASVTFSEEYFKKERQYPMIGLGA